MRILLGTPDVLVSRVLVRLLVQDWARESARADVVAVGRARALDADEVGRRADERAAARDLARG